MMKNILLALGLLLTPQVMADNANDAIRLKWQDLRPESERDLPLLPPNPHAIPGIDNDEEIDPMDWEQPVGQLVSDYNGKKITLPGFVVPLEGDEVMVTEFLLVPYFGACVHVPPPPTNQLVHVKYPEGIPMDIIWDAVLVTGTLNSVAYDFNGIIAGYSLVADLTTPYDEQ